MSECLGSDRIDELLGGLDGWGVVEGQRLRKEFGFGNFVDALSYVNRLGELAEELGHHPDIHLSWGKVVVEIWTHSAGGLTEKDFEWAKRVDNLG